MEFWKKPSFLALQKAWYQRLKDDGFSDIEHPSGTSLKRPTGADSKYRQDTTTREGKEAYFRLMAHLVNQEKFVKEIDQVVMTLHANGAKIVDIQSALEKIGLTRTRGAIRFRIRKFEMRWGIKFYDKKGLNLE